MLFVALLLVLVVGLVLTRGRVNLPRVFDGGGPERSARASSLLGTALTGHTGPVYSVAFSPDGTTLATAGEDNTVLLWDVTDPATAHQLSSPLTGHTDDV